MSSPKTVAFFGATTGVGLAALKKTLAAGHQCVALCRTPAKLSALIPLAATPNLTIVPGDAHDVAAVSQCLSAADGRLVDALVSTVGNPPGGASSAADPDVCAKLTATVRTALGALRRRGVDGHPLIVMCSSTGLSDFGRDVPVVMMPIYKTVIRAALRDKKRMEDGLVESGEAFTIVRASALVNGASNKTIRVGVENPQTGRESTVIGYTISREDAGAWIAENLVLNRNATYVNRIVTITY